MRIPLYVTAFALVVGHFVYQSFTEQAWERAIERSYFQVTALIVVYVQMKLFKD